MMYINKKIKFTNSCCKDTSFSPHLNRDRKWAQQAQYNRFVREWVKEIGLAAIFTTAIGVWMFGRGR